MLEPTARIKDTTIKDTKPAAEPGLWELMPCSTSAFFFDVDGTLLDIKPHPADVVADAGLKSLLLQLAAKTKGALALVSGRMIEDIDRIFVPLVLPAAGLHGGQIRLSQTVEMLASRQNIDLARPEVSAFVEKFQGLMLEDKGATLAIHFRQCPELSEIVRISVEELASRHGLEAQEGKMVVELKPSAFDKGTAITNFLTEPPFFGRRPVFFGDDLTDEKGFEAVNRVGGISVKIGSFETPTKALYRLAEPAALRWQIEQMI